MSSKPAENTGMTDGGGKMSVSRHPHNHTKILGFCLVKHCSVAGLPHPGSVGFLFLLFKWEYSRRKIIRTGNISGGSQVKVDG